MMPNMKNEVCLYILMRNDLQSMTPGRCMAQAAHAANAVVKEFGNLDVVKKWQKQTKQGFGTTIVLSANESKIIEIAISLVEVPVRGWVTDPEYSIRVSLEAAELMLQNYNAEYCNFVFDYTAADDKTTSVVRSEKTCYYVLGTKDTLFPYLGGLPLY